MIGVIVRAVPDLVEGLEIEEREVVPYKYIANELDEYAVEQAVTLKEKYGFGVDVIGLANEDAYDDIDEALYMALAKGVDNAYKVLIPKTTSYSIAKALSDFLRKYDLILTGTLSVDEYYGVFGAIVSDLLNIPYVGSVRSVDIDGDYAIVKKELGGGAYLVLKVKKPAVFGIISLEKPPRYVPFSKLRKIMQEREIEELDLDIEEVELNVKFIEPPKPETEFIEGSPEEIAEKLAEVIRGLIK